MIPRRSDAAAAARGGGPAALAWGALAAGACAAVAPFEPSLLEEGILLHLAQRLARGERLYRDVIAFTGPLPFEALALLFRAFGEEIWVGRAAVALLHGAATAAAFAIARRACPGTPAHAAAAAYAAAPALLFPLFGIYYYTTLAFHLSVLAVGAALRGLESRPFALAAGVLVAAVALCKQPLGVALALTLGLALALCAAGPARRRTLLAFGAGGAGAAVVTVASFWAVGTLGDAVRALVVLPASLGRTFEAPFVNLWPLGEFTPEIRKSQPFYLPYFYFLSQGLFAKPGWPVVLATQLLYALPILAAAATGIRGATGRLAPAAWLHGALLVTWISNLHPRTDWGHLVHVLPPALAQLCILLPARPATPAARRGLSAVCAASVGLLAAGSGWALWLIHSMAQPEPFAPRVPLRPVSAVLRADLAGRAVEFLSRHTEPGAPIFVARAEPLLYFATATRNPVAYPGVIPGIREEQERAIVAALPRVRYVVMSDVDQPAMTYYRDELPAVQAYLERHFRVPEELLEGQVPWLLVLEPGPDRGETAIDLIALAPEARPFRRDASGRFEQAPRFADRLATRQNRRPLGFHLGARGGGLEFDVAIPPGAVFQADVGLDTVTGETSFYEHPLGARVSVSIGHGGVFTPIAEAPAMTGGVSWTRWSPVEADLAPWAGQRVTLRLELTAPRVEEEEIGYFASPRIAFRPPRAAAGR